MPSRPSTRTEPTAAVTSLRGTGVVKVIRRQIPVSGGSVMIPDKISFMFIQNAGDNVIRFNFNDDQPTDFFTLGPRDRFPVPIPLDGRVMINARSVGTESTVECIFWG